MPEQRLDQIEEVYHEARRRPPEEREAYLNDACGDDSELRREVESLLKYADHATGDEVATSDAADASARPVEMNGDQSILGTRIGPYKLLEQIGEGGFGVVYMAEQREPVIRRVALKVIKLGMDTRQVIARFEAERQALAMMDHPNIARVLDAGATDEGRPYFVMEYVRGEPITDYCDKNNLTVRERLELFTEVCHAVQHAHQKGIIHRDIKPSNVLVTIIDGRPVPKVIDFGIAKATNARLTEKTLFTEHRQMIGTPEYMSPEQAEMSGVDIDTRSDVYALGVLLYELLTGATPFDPKMLREAGYGEIQRIIREEEPPKPSTRLSTLGDLLPGVAVHRRTEPKKLSTLVRGELDWIVMRCLEKDRTRRYATANGLAMDVLRHLNDEPVEAGPPSRSYRLQKLIRRNKGAFVAAALVFVALTLGMIGTSYGLVRAEHARVAEAQRAAELEQVAEFQASQLRDIDTAMMGVRLRSDIIDKRRAVLENVAHDEQQIKQGLRELERALAGVNFTNVALESLEENIFDRALAAIEEQFEDQPLVKARLLQTVASTMRDLGLLDRATAPQTEALDIRRRVLGDEHSDTLLSVIQTGFLLQHQGKLAEAEPYYLEALEGYRHVHGDENRSTLTAMSNMGGLLQEQGRYAEAEPYHRAALEGYHRVLGDEHPSTLSAISNMGWLLHQRGNYAEAEPYYREALEGRRCILGDDNPDTLTSINNLATLLGHQGRFVEAEPYYRMSVEGHRRILGDEHRHTLASINNMGFLLFQLGRFDDAEPLYREALESRRRVLGDEHPDTLSSVTNMGFLLAGQDKFAESEPYFREALDGYRRVLGDEHPSTLTAINNVGWLFHRQGKIAEAEPYYRQALEGHRRILGDEHPDTLISINNVGALLQTQGRFAEAVPYFRDALESCRRLLGDEHPDTLRYVNNMGVLLQDQGKLAEAEPYLREAMEGYRRLFGDEHPHTLTAVNHMATIRFDLGDFDEAERFGAEAVKIARAVYPEGRWRMAAFLSLQARRLAAMERFGEAEAGLLEAHNVFKNALGAEHSRTLRSISSLADLYDAWHEAAPGNGYDAKATTWRARLPDPEEAGADGDSDADEAHAQVDESANDKH